VEKILNKANIENEDRAIQSIRATSLTALRGAVSHHAAHEFRWVETNSGGTGTCSCGEWELYGTRPGALTEESAKRNHRLHLANRGVYRRPKHLRVKVNVDELWIEP